MISLSCCTVLLIECSKWQIKKNRVVDLVQDSFLENLSVSEIGGFVLLYIFEITKHDQVDLIYIYIYLLNNSKKHNLRPSTNMSTEQVITFRNRKCVGNITYILVYANLVFCFATVTPCNVEILP